MGGFERTRVLGTGALALTVLLWSSFALSSRALGASGLTEADAAIIRFSVPVLILAPWLPRTLRAVTRERRATLALLLAGGLPQFLLFALGARLTSAGLTGLLVPGSVPLFVTLLALGRQRVPARRMAAVSAIVAGVAASATLVTTEAGPGGIAILLLSGRAWARYTTGLQRTALRPMDVVVVVGAVSAATGLALALTGALPSHLLDGRTELSHVAAFAALQGVGTGLLSTTCYAVAVRCLGGAVSSTAGALSPVVTVLLAIPLFGEQLGPGLATALLLIVTGVVLFNTAPTAATRRREVAPRARPVRAAHPAVVGRPLEHAG